MPVLSLSSTPSPLLTWPPNHSTFHPSVQRTRPFTHHLIVHGIGIVTLEEINGHSFAWARREVFTRALTNLDVRPGSIVVDGTSFFDGYLDIPYACIAKADATYASVAAASIVAKCTRDGMVKDVCVGYREVAERYGWSTNMGYPTKAHKDAIRAHGCTWYHRIKAVAVYLWRPSLREETQITLTRSQAKPSLQG